VCAAAAAPQLRGSAAKSSYGSFHFARCTEAAATVTVGAVERARRPLSPLPLLLMRSALAAASASAGVTTTDVSPEALLPLLRDVRGPVYGAAWGVAS